MKKKIRTTSVPVTLIFGAIAIGAVAQAAGKYDPASTVPTARLAPTELLKGANYDVADPVRIERFLGSFELHSPNGTWTVNSGLRRIRGHAFADERRSG